MSVFGQGGRDVARSTAPGDRHVGAGVDFQIPTSSPSIASLAHVGRRAPGSCTPGALVASIFPIFVSPARHGLKARKSRNMVAPTFARATPLTRGADDAGGPPQAVGAAGLPSKTRGPAVRKAVARLLRARHEAEWLGRSGHPHSRAWADDGPSAGRPGPTALLGRGGIRPALSGGKPFPCLRVPSPGDLLLRERPVGRPAETRPPEPGPP